MADLALVEVRPDGSAGKQVGALVLHDGIIEATGDVAAGVLASLRLRSGLDDPQLWERLTTQGWSNGYIMIKRGQE